MTKEEVLQVITNNITDNNSGAITAAVMRYTLNTMVEYTPEMENVNLDGYLYISTVTPSTTPMTIATEDKVFYIAVEEGDYSNFGVGTISELSVIKSDNGSWIVEGLGIPLNVFAKEWQLKTDGAEVFGLGTYTYKSIGQYTKLMTEDFRFSKIKVNSINARTSNEIEVNYAAYIVTGKASTDQDRRQAPVGLIEQSSHQLIAEGNITLSNLSDDYFIEIPQTAICPKGSQVVVYLSSVNGSDRISMMGSDAGSGGYGNEEGTSNVCIFSTTGGASAVTYGATWLGGQASGGYLNVALTLIKDSVYVTVDSAGEILNEKIKSVYLPFGEKQEMTIHKEYPQWLINASTRKVQTHIYSTGYSLSMFKMEKDNYYRIEILNSDKFQNTIGICAISDTENLVSEQSVIVLAAFQDPDVQNPIILKSDKEQYLLIEHYGECAQIYQMVNPPDELYTPVQKIVKESLSIEMPSVINEVTENINPKVHIQIPDVVYAMVGLELNIWNDTIALSMDRGLMSPLNYHTEWSCSKGKVISRGFRFTPTASDVGTYSCTCKIYSTLNNALIDSKTFSIKVVNNSSLTSVKNILFCGDSLGRGTAHYINANIQEFTGSKPNMVGSVESTMFGLTTKHLSYGGWSWSNFATVGIKNWRLQVSNIGALEISAKYIDSSNNAFSVVEINTTDGTGNILITKAYMSGYGNADLTSMSGTLTKISDGTGDATITYTGGVEESGNPLWNERTNTLDFAKYRSEIGLAGKIDMIIFQLGINNNGAINSGDEVKSQIVSLYNAYVADNPNGLFVLGVTPNSGNDYDGMGVNYGASSISQGITGYAKNEEKIRDLYLTMAQSGDYPRMRVIGENLFIDRYYGYALSERDISARYGGEGKKEKYHNNYVHPDDSGYAQLADGICGGIVGFLTE